MKKSLMIMAVLGAWALAITPTAMSDLPSGQDFNLAEYRGKVVVLDFWASWCVPCRRSFPWLNAMNAKYSDDGLVVIGINVDREPASAAEFLQKYPASFQISYDSKGVLAKKFGVQAMPSSFVIGRDGQINAHHLGFKVRRQDEYEAVIVAALRQEKVQ